MPQIHLPDTDQYIDYELKINSKASRVSIRIKEDNTVTLTVPTATWTKKGLQFLDSKISWIAEAISKNSFEKYSNLKHGSEISILGEIFQVVHVEYKLERSHVIEKENKLLVYTTETNSKAALEKLSAYLRKHYSPLIKHRTVELASQHGFQVNSIVIKDQSTRWGSCSSQKNLNFNWRLIFAPREVMEYVIIHELAHTVHMDHSKNFWRLVAQFDPHYRTSKRWLREHRKILSQY